MQGIFISYRREDAAANAGRLYDRLASHFGEDRVFMDVEGIEPGVDFVEEIERRVASCEVLIVMIGAGWLATDSTGKRRLDDPKDFVRIEAATALARQIRVVPVLVNGAVMPREEDLPADLVPLARRQAIELTHKQWDATSAQLIRTLERILDGDSPLPVMGTRRRRRLGLIGGAVALVAAAVGVYFTMTWWEAEPVRPTAPVGVAVAPPADTARTPEKTAPAAEKPPAAPAEKAVPLPTEKPPTAPAEKATPLAPQKPPAPSTEKAAPHPTEKPATPSAAKTEAPAPARAPEKALAPQPSPAAKTPAAQPPAKAAPTIPTAPSSRGTETASTPAPPDGKTAAPATAQKSEPPPGPVAVAPTPTPPVTAPVAPSASLPATLPRVGDFWEYRMRSKWPTVQPRTYTHRVTAVSAREVAQTISVDTNPDVAAARQSFTPDTGFVEWRGQGFYLLEFNPFLVAFGGLQNGAATPNVPAMPAENPMQAGWYGKARIRGYESVSVAAGTFNALKMEIDSNRRPTEGGGMSSREPVRALLTLWYAPEVKRTVKMLRIVMAENGMHLDEDTYELVRYRVQ